MQVRAYRGKRIFDISVGFVGMVLVSPLLAVIAVLVRLYLGSPILFRQSRPGLNGECFYVLKFRTMLDLRDDSGKLLPDSERLTGFGKLLRSTSLDELPEIINVIRGEMSLVGPRPLLVQYLKRYSAFQMRRHEVRPGITGWAQVQGRNAISWEDKFALDVWYVEHQSLFLDLKIIVMTFWKLITREGINQPGEATAAEFMGTAVSGPIAGPAAQARDNFGRHQA